VDLGFWRDIAIVWLAFLCFIGMIAPLVMAFFAVKGVHVAVDRLPRWLGQAQRVSHKVRAETVTIADRIAEPVIAAERKATRLSRFVRGLAGDDSQPR
jgi:hypothetical protein